MTTTRIRTATLIQDTLDCMTILASCEEFADDCLLWTGVVGNTVHPIYTPHGRGCTLVRRDAYRLSGRELKPRVPIANRCEEPLCVNPAHLFESTTSAIARKAAKRGVWSGLARRAKISASKRRNAKLPGGIDTARAIRASTDSGPVLAARYGVDKSLINGIKRGLVWQEYTNPFFGLMT